jgi:peptide/nickel transport system permease protein
VNYVLRKLGFYAVALWAAVTLNFLIPRLLPGNPVDILLAKLQQRGGTVTPETREAYSALLGGDTTDSLLQQYGTYLSNLLHGDLGVSVTYFPTPVSEVIGTSMPWTVVLVGIATVLAATIGVLLGAFVGWRPGTWLDSAVPLTTLLAAVPYFWLALVLVYLLSRVLGWFPSQGGYDVVLDPGWSPEFIGSAIEYGFVPR